MHERNNKNKGLQSLFASSNKDLCEKLSITEDESVILKKAIKLALSESLETEPQTITAAEIARHLEKLPINLKQNQLGLIILKNDQMKSPLDIKLVDFTELRKRDNYIDTFLTPTKQLNAHALVLVHKTPNAKKIRFLTEEILAYNALKAFLSDNDCELVDYLKIGSHQFPERRNYLSINKPDSVQPIHDLSL